MQRSPKEQLGIIGGDQIGYLEKQLDNCHTALLADSTSPVCSASQAAQLQATQKTIKQLQPKWPMQPYAEEVSFYLAEEARRQQAAGAPTPAK
jgi:hypothetical protein